MALILVIEDEQHIRTNLLKILKFNGFEAVGAENGEAGVELVKRYSPDLIVCDIMMPQMDGYGVLETLAQNSETASIPFIFLSARSDRSDIRQGMDLGADDYLTKPFSNSELIRAIHSRLKKQATIRQPMIGAIKQAVVQLNELAYYDPLTKLPNRILFDQKLAEILAEAQVRQQAIALLCLQVCRYKNIDVALGSSRTNQLLQLIAERLNGWMQSSNLSARLNEAEFSLVLLRDDLHKQQIDQLAQELLTILSVPYSVEDQMIRVQFNIGIAVSSQEHSSAAQLLSHARLAMQWQQEDTSSYQYYSAEMATQSSEQGLLEADLYQALERSELELYYQPQVNLVTGRIIGAEALLRWHHPRLGLIPPNRFIPIAEETGLIIPIGEWVLKTACQEVMALKAIYHSPIRMAVNLSTQQLKQQDFLDKVLRLVAEIGLAPDQLELELTETGMMKEVEAISSMLRQLKASGIQISIDDFGTGYSSLSYLKYFPLDTLKIDRSFVSDMTTDTGNASIVTAIIAMAHSLKLKVIAEGVETVEQLTFLKKQGCHAMQGFLFSPPVPTAKFREMLTDNSRLDRAVNV